MSQLDEILRTISQLQLTVDSHEVRLAKNEANITDLQQSIGDKFLDAVKSIDRAKNLIIANLKEGDDASAVAALLTCAIINESCVVDYRRLGRLSQTDAKPKSRLLLIEFTAAGYVSKALRCIGSLKAIPAFKQAFFNRDMSKEERHAAYLRRCELRAQRLNPNTKDGALPVTKPVTTFSTTSSPGQATDTPTHLRSAPRKGARSRVRSNRTPSLQEVNLTRAKTSSLRKTPSASKAQVLPDPSIGCPSPSVAPVQGTSNFREFNKPNTQKE